MSEQELLEENKMLKEEIQKLKGIIESKVVSKDITAYQIIANLISEKVNKDIHEDWKDWGKAKQSIKRKMMDDLKWELHVRYANNFEKEHIDPAKEFINNYEIEEFYKKERYKGAC